MKKIVLISLILGIGISGPFLTTARGQQADQQEPEDKPTVIKKGQSTKKEKAYGKQFKKMVGNPFGQKLTAIKEPNPVGIVIGIGSHGSGRNNPTITANQFLETLACKADAIVVGNTTKKASHLTDDEMYVYTAYDFQVKIVLKDNSALPISVNKNIEVTRPGGNIKIENQVIDFDVRAYPRLKRNEEYLLFLEFVPAANGYKVSSDRGDFLLGEAEVKNHSRRGLPTELRNGVTSDMLINMISSAASANCNQYLSGGDNQ